MSANEVDCAICGRVGDAVGVLDGVTEMNSTQNSAQATFGFILGPSRDDVFKVFRRSRTFRDKMHSNSNLAPYYVNYVITLIKVTLRLSFKLIEWFIK